MNDNEKLTENVPGWLDVDSLIPKLPDFSGEKIAVLSRREERELARKARKKKSLRNRKPYTRKPGTVHPKKKQATRSRQRRERWHSDPFWCVAYGRGYYALDRKLWDQHIAPLWEKYDSKDLKVERYRGYGTKEKPHTVWTLRVVHASEGLVYDGSDVQLYLLSDRRDDISEPGRNPAQEVLDSKSYLVQEA